MADIKAGNNEFYMEEAGEVIAKIEFTQSENNMINITHTNVYEGHNGKGLGKKVVHHVADYAKEEQKLINPICSYARKVLENNENYRDLIAK